VTKDYSLGEMMKVTQCLIVKREEKKDAKKAL